MAKKTTAKISCRVCQSENLVRVVSLGKQFLSDFVTEDFGGTDYPLDLLLCKNCKLLQLEKTVPQKRLYNERYGYKSGINDTMKKELTEIVSKTKRKIALQPNDLVIDIGANDGTLLSNYPNNVVRVAVEPIKKLATECKVNADFVINDFFNLKALKKTLPAKLFNKKAKIVTAISMFYDLEDPNSFVSDVKAVLAPDGIFVIQQNYLLGMLQQNAFDNIVHEHIEYYSLLSLEKLLERHNLEVFDVETTDLNGGSFRTYIAHKNTFPINSNNVSQMRSWEKEAKLHQKQTYEQFNKRVANNKKEIVKFVNEVIKKGKKIYLYGASTRGNTLIQYYGLNKNQISAAVERNPEKWGKKIASVGIPIISEAQARKDKPDYLLVLPWFFKEEFLKREANYLRSGGHFIFPLPKLEII